MRPSLPQPVWLLVLSGVPVFADFNSYSFAGNNGTKALTTCPGSQFACVAPSVCSYEQLASKWYCCIPGQSNGVCWTPSLQCSGSSNSAGTGQQLCTLGDSSYCCEKSLEQCTETANQINICWSTTRDPLASLNATKLNETFSSLSSAHPSAASWPISATALLAMTSTTPGASTTQASSTATKSASTGQTASTGGPLVTGSSVPSDSKKSGLSGGAIAGIVVGVIGAFAIVALAAFLLLRPRNNKQQKMYPQELGNEAARNELGGASTVAAPPLYKYQHMAEAPNNQAPIELPAGQPEHKP